MTSRQEAEELCQEVFALFYQQHQNHDEVRPVGPWLYGIARNLLRNRNRRMHRWLEFLRLLLFDQPSAIQTPEQAFEESHVRRELQGSLAKLSEIDRSLIILFSEGYTHEEMAAIFALTPAVTRKRLQRAKQKLKDLFIKRSKA